MTTRYSLVTVREEKSKEAIINLEGTAQRWLGMEKIYKDLQMTTKYQFDKVEKKNIRKALRNQEGTEMVKERED